VYSSLVPEWGHDMSFQGRVSRAYGRRSAWRLFVVVEDFGMMRAACECECAVASQFPED
jgi:hypothetical protein